MMEEDNLDTIKAMKSLFLTASDVANVLGCDPQTIRNQAQKNPAALGFPTIVIGTRIKIPRKPFIRFIEG